MSTKAVVLLAFLLVSSLAAIAPSFSAEPVRVYVDPPAVIDPDVLFNVSVKVDNLIDLAGAMWELEWDPTLLRAVDMTEIMFHEVAPQSEWDNIWRLRHSIDNELGTAGYVYLWADNDRARAGGYLAISGNHTMATIRFQVLGIGNCTLQFTREGPWATKLADPHGNRIERDVTDGFFSNSVPPSPLPPLPIESSEVLIYVDPRRVRNESLAVNDTFTVDVKMDSLTNHSGIMACHFHLYWNSTLLECIGVNEVVFHESVPENEWDNIEWFIYVDNDWGEMELRSFLLEEGWAHAVFGNHTWATITFTVKNIGRCELHLVDIVAQEVAVRGQMFYSYNGDGYFDNTLNGDLNGDSIVDLFDALILGKSLGACWNGLDWNEAADINGDLQIDIFDAILLGNLFGHTR